VVNDKRNHRAAESRKGGHASRVWGRDMKRETWLPAVPESAAAARSMVRDAAARAGLEGEAAWDLMLATTEALNNAVQHGEAWSNDCVLLVIERCPLGLRVEVSDRGTFDAALEPAPLDATCGRGLQIIAALVDRFEVRSGNGRTLVRFEKHGASGGAHGVPEHAPTGSSRNGAPPGHPERAPRLRPVGWITADAGGAV
jgi:anti-sigma regulatory factor (Ser/Thr protein kinase)